MSDSPLVSFMYQLLEFAFSMFDLTFSQLLPTLALLVGASLQFLFDFLLSFCFPNRPSSSSLSDFYPSSDDDLYLDANDGYYLDSTASRRPPFDTSHDESWWPMQGLGRATRTHQVSAIRDGRMPREPVETPYDKNDDRVGNSSMLSRRGLYDMARGNPNRVGYDRLGDHFGNADGITRRMHNEQANRHTNDNPNATTLTRARVRSQRQVGLSQQSPSRSLRHSSPMFPSSTSSWLMLKRSIKKYASKISMFFLSSLWRQPNYGRRQWERASLLHTPW